MSEAATAALDKWAETALSRADLLDKFYGINRADLELGRRQLIDTLRGDQDKEVPNG